MFTEPSRRLWALQTFLAGVALATLVVWSLPPHPNPKDVQQDYLATRAWLDGRDPLAPLPELSNLYLGPGRTWFDHPSPHPPIRVLAFIPLALLPYDLVAPLWLATNLALLVVVGRWLGLSYRGSLALAAWPPLWMVLYQGALELLILALAVSAWHAAEGGCERRAGFWFGIAACLKLYPALLLVPFLAARRWRVVWVAGLAFIAGQVGNALVVGPGGLLHYYRDILPELGRRYAGFAMNSAPYGALLRLLGGVDGVQPLVEATALVLPLTALVSALSLLSMLRLDPRAGATGLLLAMPTVWYTYATIALPQMIRLAHVKRDLLVRLGLAAASCIAPIVGLPLKWGWLPGWSASLVAAIQPLGYAALLLSSLVHRVPGERRGQMASSREESSARVNQ